MYPKSVPATLALATLAFAGCYRAPAVSAPAPTAPTAPTDTRGFLVWRNDGTTVVTRWLDAQGEERGRAAGAWLAHAGELWQLDVRGTTGVHEGCRERDDGSIEAGEGSFEELALVTRDARRRLPIVTPDVGAATGAAMYAQGVLVRGSLGPLVFGEERIGAFACGAHGSLGVTAFEFDARRGERTEVPAHPIGSAMAPALEAALEVASARGVLIDPLDPDSAWRITESVPRWRDGELGARHLAVIDACYACTVGDWSSYSASVWIDEPRVPPTWAALAHEVPRPVALALRDEEGIATGVSWGAVDATWQATFAPR